jgi:hypothetical protein
LIEDGGILYPIEIKKSADPKATDIRQFSLLEKIHGIKRGSGGLVCLYENLASVSDRDKVIPVSML